MGWVSAISSCVLIGNSLSLLSGRALPAFSPNFLPLAQSNYLVFMAELFWWFEVVKPSFVQPRDARPQGGDQCSRKQAGWSVRIASPGYSFTGKPVAVSQSSLDKFSLNV